MIWAEHSAAITTRESLARDASAIADGIAQYLVAQMAELCKQSDPNEILTFRFAVGLELSTTFPAGGER